MWTSVIQSVRPARRGSSEKSAGQVRKPGQPVVFLVHRGGGMITIRPAGDVIRDPRQFGAASEVHFNAGAADQEVRDMKARRGPDLTASPSTGGLRSTVRRCAGETSHAWRIGRRSPAETFARARGSGASKSPAPGIVQVGTHGGGTRRMSASGKAAPLAASARRQNSVTSAAPASSAIAALSNAEAPAPSTATRRPRNEAKSIGSAA